MFEHPTLASLLWSVLGGLEQEYHRHGAASGEMPSLDLQANLLRALDETGTDLKALPSVLCLSRRAVTTRVATAVRHGWAQELKLENQTRLRLTARGSEVAHRWRSLQKQAEAQWQAKIGVDNGEQLRAALVGMVAAFPLEHPHYPAGYGAADASITGGGGQDWKPVLRAKSEAVATLPLSALLSQAIVAFAVDYEKESPVALSLSATIIQRIPVEGRSLRELGHSVGVSALIRHGFVSVIGDRKSGKVFLTPRGIAVAEAYHRRVDAVENGWRDRFGSESVVALRQSLETVTSAHRRAIDSIELNLLRCSCASQ